MAKNNRIVHGFGLNDADYLVEEHFAGARKRCPYYVVWASMIGRVHGMVSEKTPRFGYEETIVCEEWSKFSTFKKWMETKDWKNMELDKDLIYPGNKTYSPQTCTFITKQLNRAITKKKRNKSIYKQGVSCAGIKYQAEINMHSKRKRLGSFRTEDEAHLAYSKEKYKYLYDFMGINNDIDIALRSYLFVFLKYIERLENAIHERNKDSD